MFGGCAGQAKSTTTMIGANSSQVAKELNDNVSKIQGNGKTEAVNRKLRLAALKLRMSL